MSLILEALKKSEAKRQLGAAPGLGTPFTVARRRRSALPLMAVLIVVVAGFGWWYLRPSATPAPASPGTVPPRAKANEPARTMAATTPAAPPRVATSGATIAAAAQPGAANVDATTQMPAQAPPLRPHDLSEIPRPAGMAIRVPADDAGADARNARRTAFARSTAHASNPPAAAPAAPMNATAETASAAAHPGAVAAPPATTVPGAPAHATAGPAIPMAHPAQTQAPRPASAAPQTPAPAPAVTSAPVPPGTVKPEPPPATPAPAEHLPMYYEMPYDVRKDLPPLVVSMHVYGKDPAQRFVVVDGERKAEGDAIKDGLTLREIRNDGMVLEFRGQRFFYPRPGR